MRGTTDAVRLLLAVLFACATQAPAHADEVEFAVLQHFSGIDLVETINEVQHEHGGPPASLHRASINFEVRDTRAHTISVKSLAIVYAHCKKGEKRSKTDVKALAITGHELFTWDDANAIAKATTSIKTPAGGPKRYSVKVTFSGIKTYSGCAFAIDLVVDRARKKIELPLDITRLEPLRD